MRTLLANVLLLGALFAVRIVHAEAAIVNNTGPGCDAGEPSCAISGAINEALRNSNSTDDLIVNGQRARARGCANFGGHWEASLFGGIRCSVAPSINQPFSFVGPLDVAQQGCRFSYFDFGGLQRGTIRGRTIRIPKAKFRKGTIFRSGKITGKGRGRVQSEDQARVKISALFKGEINGIRTNCTIKWTTDFVRLPPVLPPPPPPPRPVIPPALDFNRSTVSVNYEWPNLGSILFAGGNTVVGPSVEYLRLGGQNIIVDISGHEVTIIYPNGLTLGGGPKTFDGIVVSIISGDPETGTEPITSYFVIGSNIPGYNDGQVAFDATHLYVNQLGFSSFPPNSFIKIFVGFGR